MELSVKNIIGVAILCVTLLLAACNGQPEYQPEADGYVLAENTGAETTQPAPTSESTEPVTLPQSTNPSQPAEPVYSESAHPGYSWVLPPIYSWIQQFGDGFVRVTGDGKASIICLLTGEVIIPPKFQMVGDHEGFQRYMPAQLNGRWGVINADGEVVLPFEYVLVRVWRDYGVAMVRCDNWNYSGIVELYTGRVIVPFGLYTSISEPEDGIAQVSRRYGSPPNHHNVRGFINVATGEEVVSLIHSNHSRFSYGLMAARADDLWGFINISGDVVIPHIYDHIDGSFTNGTIAVSRGGLWGIIDTTGAYILPPTHDEIRRHWCVNGFGEFSIVDPVSQNRYIGILDMQTGEIIVPAIYQGSFFAGEDIVLMRPGDWDNHADNVLINLETGQKYAFPFVIGDCIQYCGPIPPGFVDGVSIVHIRGSEWRRMYGLADNQGREILPPIYDFIDWLPGGLLMVSKGPSQWGIVDRDGQVVLPLVYCDIEWTLGGRDPNHDISAIRVGGEWVQAESSTGNPNWRLEGALWGFVDINGQIVVPPILDFLDVRTIGPGTAAVQTSDGLWGLIRIQEAFNE